MLGLDRKPIPLIISAKILIAIRRKPIVSYAFALSRITLTTSQAVLSIIKMATTSKTNNEKWRC